jgi:hypothetical protein
MSTPDLRANPPFGTPSVPVPGTSTVAQNELFGCGRLPEVRPVTVTVPPVVEHLLTADVAVEIAEVFTNGLVYPERIVVDSPASGRPGQGRRFPGWPGPVLVLSDENQGVCSWGVPLDDGSSPVLVGGELLDADGRRSGARPRWRTSSRPGAGTAGAWLPDRCRRRRLPSWASPHSAISGRCLPRPLRRPAGPGPGSTGSRAWACGSCCGRRPASATGGYRPPGTSTCGHSRPGCLTCPACAAPCGLTTTQGTPPGRTARRRPALTRS